VAIEVEVFATPDALNVPTVFGPNGLPLLIITTMAGVTNDYI